MDEILTDVRDRTAVLAKGTKPSSTILPERRRSHSVADVTDFTALLAVNPDFSCLAENKAISTKQMGTISFFEMERMESSTRSLLEANSYSLWLLSGLLSQFKRDGFDPSDPALFDSAILSLSASLSGQTRTAASLTDFLVSKHRESYREHASLPLSASQKHELLITQSSNSSLFDQGLLENLSSQVKKDSFISSSLSMAKLACSQTSSKGKYSSTSGAMGSSNAGPSRYSSPLDYPRLGSTSSGKCSASPSRGGGGKWSRGGRGVSLTPKSKRGFRK